MDKDTYTAEAEYKEKLVIKKRVEHASRQKIGKQGLKDFSKAAAYMRGLNQYIDRGIIAAHLDFEPIASLIAQSKPFTVVSGLNPSSPLHLGHLALFKFLKSLQDLGAEIIIPLTNDESFIDGKAVSIEVAADLAHREIIPSILALGFDPARTTFIVHSESPDLYLKAMQFGSLVSMKTLTTLFGKESVDTAAKVYYRGALQLTSILMPQFTEKKHVLVPVGPDQHPYLLLTRDVANKAGLIPPSELVFNFLPSLKNPLEKMSGSKPETAIYLNDTPEAIRKKIQSAYTGSLSTLEGHRRYGAIPEICPVFQILNYHHPDQLFIDEIYQSYKSGKMTAGELKQIVIDFVQQMIT